MVPAHIQTSTKENRVFRTSPKSPLAQEFNDSAWPQAYEQPEDCCPWRDPMLVWERVNARWIGPSPLDYPLNISGPRSKPYWVKIIGYPPVN